MYVYSVGGKKFLEYDNSTSEGGSVALVDHITGNNTLAAFVQSTSEKKLIILGWYVSVAPII